MAISIAQARNVILGTAIPQTPDIVVANINIGGTVECHGTVGISNAIAIIGTVTLGGTQNIHGTIGVIDLAGTVHITGGTVDINNMPGIVGTVHLTGGTVSIDQMPGSVQIARNYAPNILFEIHIGAGSLLTSSYVDIRNYRVKTYGAKIMGGNGSVMIEVSSSGTNDIQVNEYYTDDLGSGTYESKSFEEAYEYTRGKIYMSGTPTAISGTAYLYLASQT